MDKETLQKKIESGDTVWLARSKKPEKLKLHKDYFVDCENKLCECNKNHTILLGVYKLDKIFETKEQAEWHLKNDAERTERFEPPMWEEIQGYYCFTFVIDNYPMWFSIEKGNSITINSSSCDNIFEKYASDVTKENYEKACEIVRDLFKGEK